MKSYRWLMWASGNRHVSSLTQTHVTRRDPLPSRSLRGSPRPFLTGLPHSKPTPGIKRMRLYDCHRSVPVTRPLNQDCLLSSP